MTARSNREYWWRDNQSFDLTTKSCLAVAKPGLNRIFERIWKFTIIAAWTYEIVRRLPNLPDIEKSIAAEDLRELGGLPPFLELNEKQKFLLQSNLSFPRPVILNKNNARPTPTDYTGSLPSWSFNLKQMSKKAIMNWIGRWVDAEKKKWGVARTKGKRGHISRNQFQDFKLGDWRWVEACDLCPRPNEKLSKLENDWRSKAKNHGLKHYQTVLTDWRLAEMTLFVYPEPAVVPETNLAKRRTLRDFKSLSQGVPSAGFRKLK